MEDEATPTTDPTTPTVTPHPILQNLIATLGPIRLQFLMKFLATLTPAQAAELHKTCCDAQPKS